MPEALYYALGDTIVKQTNELNQTKTTTATTKQETNRNFGKKK